VYQSVEPSNAIWLAILAFLHPMSAAASQKRSFFP